MTKLERLYQIIKRDDILLYYGDVGIAPAVTIRDGGDYYIAVDANRVTTPKAELSVLAHELGHIQTGALYCPGESLEQKRRMECRAERWAIEQLIPLSELKAAIRAGETTPWALAEHFDVSEPLMRQALQYYQEAKGQTFQKASC